MLSPIRLHGLLRIGIGKPARPFLNISRPLKHGAVFIFFLSSGWVIAFINQEFSPGKLELNSLYLSEHRVDGANCFNNSWSMLKYLFPLLVACTCSLAKRPNILLIVTDDQAPHTLSVYGNKVCETPHIDKLASSGMVLDQAYHMGSMSGAVCSPSRTMIMSGRTLWHLPPVGKSISKKRREK